jgi:hypothetical protein
VVRLTICPGASDDTINIRPDQGAITATAYEDGRIPKIVPIECVFVEIVTESKICHFYKSVLLTIKVAARNVYGTNNS